MTTKTTATFALEPEGSGTPFGATCLDLVSKGYVEADTARAVPRSGIE
jgi:hypothetical protein